MLSHECVAYGTNPEQINRDLREIKWTLKDEAELWAGICDDPCIHPDDRVAAFKAALQGDPDWYQATTFEREAGAEEQLTDKRRGGLSCLTGPGRQPHERVFVGWDRSLETFFGQVWEERDELGSKYDRLTHWVGSNRHEVPSIFALRAMMHADAEIPASRIRQLHAWSLSREPGRRQEPERFVDQHDPPLPQYHHPKLTHEL